MIEGFGRRHDLDTTCHFIGTTAAIIGAIAAGTSAGASIYAANKSTDAANTAATDQLQATNEGTALQAQNLDYQAAQNEINRQANYQQYAAREAKLGTIGQMLGFGPGYGATPAYVPGIVPTFNVPGVTNTPTNPYARVQTMVPGGA